MDNNPQSSKNHLIIFATTALAMIALIILIVVISRNDSEPTEPETQNQTNQEAGKDMEEEADEVEDQEADEETGMDEESGQTGEEDPETGTAEEEEDDDGEETETPMAGELPDDWDELSSVEKTILNPFDCPEDESGIIHLSAETGECLDPSTDEDGDQDNDNDQDDSRTEIPENAMRVDFGEAFPYDGDLELAITGLSCQNLTIVSIDTSYQTDQTLTLSQVLEDFADDWELYKADPEGWAKFHFEIDYDPADNQVYYTDFLPYLEENYKYLLNFENWLQANDPDADDLNLNEHLFNYLDCRILVSLTNNGPNRQLAHNCPAWEFKTTMELIGDKRDYGQERRVLLQPPAFDCSSEPIDFLTGEIVESGFTPFIVNSDDEIREIIVRDGADTFHIVRDQV